MHWQAKVSVMVFAAALWAAGGLAWEVPDTGQTKCYDAAGAEITCPPPNDPMAQDGSYVHRRSYTKLGHGGVELPDDAEEWLMVRDDVTGLIWEVKQDKDGSPDYSNPNDSDNEYFWYDSNPETNGGNPGSKGDGVATFDTEQFVQAINKKSYGGFSDWRFPTIRELATIVNLERYDPANENSVFPNTNSDTYWSATTNAFNGEIAWYMNFTYGDYGASSKLYYSEYLRAVRSGVERSSFNTFIDNGDGTVTDASTGLMWQQASSPNELTWLDAISYCESLTLAGYADWRLPNKEELSSIIDYSRSEPSIDTDLFPDTQWRYWSSTTYVSSPRQAWGSYFRNCDDERDAKSYIKYARAVRAGQNRLSGRLIILSPQQASGWSIGSRMPITWDPQDIQGNVEISISRSGGKDGTYEIIAVAAPNDGAFDWTVTGPISVNCALKIEPVSDPSKGTLQGLFRIGDIMVDKKGLTVQEPDGSASFNIRLGKAPTADVTVTLAATNPGECAVSPETITLTPDNWNAGEEITVTAQPDNIVDGDQLTTILTGLSASADPMYDGLNVANIFVTVQNIDTGLAIDSVYPTYGEVNANLDVKITGVNFDNNTVLYMYPDDETPAAATDATLDSPTQLSATLTAPAAPGGYTLEVSNGTESAVMPGAVAFADPPDIQAQNRKKAIIVAGGGPFPDNDLWLAAELLTQAAYIALNTQGYTRDTIQYLSLNAAPDITGDGQSDVDAPATSTDLETAVTTWAADNTSELILYLTGPARANAFQFGSDNDPDFLAPETLDDWLDDLQTTMPGPVIVVYDACQSGSFLSPLAGPNRTLITATSADERAWFLDDGEISFSGIFWRHIFYQASLFDAFRAAQSTVAALQTPLIDTDGDGAPDTLPNRRTPDPRANEDTVIGRGRNVEFTPPEITDATADPDTLAGGAATAALSAGPVADKNGSGISRVWARIISPKNQYEPASKPVLVTPTLNLADTGADNMYGNTYDGFIIGGKYPIFIHAIDRGNLQSLPKTVNVVQTDGITFEIGDLNLDGEVNLKDAMIALRCAAGQTPADAYTAFEANGDEKIGIIDCLYVLGKVAGF